MKKSELKEMIREALPTRLKQKGRLDSKPKKENCAYFGWDHKEEVPLKEIIDFVKANPQTKAWNVEIGSDVSVALGPGEHLKNGLQHQRIAL